MESGLAFCCEWDQAGGVGANCPCNKTNVYYHPHQSVGIAAGANHYKPPVAAGPPTLFYAGASCFSAFPAPREVAGPLLWEKGSCQMGPQRRVGKNTFMGPLYKELMHEAEPWGLRRGRASTSPQLPHGPPRFFMQAPLAFLRFRRRGKWRDPFYGKKGPAKWARSAAQGKSLSWARSIKN